MAELDFDVTTPTDKHAVSGLFDTLKQIRVNVQTAFLREHASKGQHKIPYGNTAGRDGQFYINTDIHAGFETPEYYHDAAWNQIEPGLKQWQNGNLNPAVNYQGNPYQAVKGSELNIISFYHYFEAWTHNVEAAIACYSLGGESQLNVRIDIESATKYNAALSRSCNSGAVQNYHTPGFAYTAAAAGMKYVEIFVECVSDIVMIPISFGLNVRRA